MPQTILLSIPATLHHKALVLHTARVAAANTRVAELNAAGDLADPFVAELVSALGELVNNIVLHGHREGFGLMEYRFTSADGYLEIEIREDGSSFDITRVIPPDLEGLPESGMGLYIARSFVDELWYEPGAPNVWNLVKYRSEAARQARGANLQAANSIGMTTDVRVHETA